MSAYSDAILADTPDVYYRLGETSGSTLTDSSGNGHTLTASGTLAPVSSLLDTDSGNGALRFQTETDLLKAAVAYSLTNRPLTVEFWVKPATLTGFAGADTSVVVGCSDGATGWQAGFKTSGKLIFTTLGHADYQFNFTISTGTKYHVVFVFKADNSTDLYVNGGFEQTITGAANMSSTTAGLQIGGRQAVQAQYMVDSIADEVAIYKSALSSTRIAAHYSAATVTPSTFKPRVMMIL